jgi:hypothetical protein
MAIWNLTCHKAPQLDWIGPQYWEFSQYDEWEGGGGYERMLLDSIIMCVH